MKPLYWRGRHPPLLALLLASAWTLGGALLVEWWPALNVQPGYAAKKQAAEKAAAALKRIGEARVEQGPPINPKLDPQRSGLIGQVMSPVTSNSGHLPAKQTSVNANFAAVVYGYLLEAGVGEGDVVAVGVSGSFPALNVATYAALDTLGARPLVLASTSASQFGANVPHLMWLDMERLLDEGGVLKIRSRGASLGGIQDQALGMDARGRAMLREVMRRNGVPYIGSSEEAELSAVVDARLARYDALAEGRPIAAYVNVGGGTISLGGPEGRRVFKPGLNTDVPLEVESVTSVMARYAARGIPVIHLAQVEDLARRHGLPVRPEMAPAVGEGQVYAHHEPRPWLAVLALLGGVVVLTLGSRTRADRESTA